MNSTSNMILACSLKYSVGLLHLMRLSICQTQNTKLHASRGLKKKVPKSIQSNVFSLLTCKVNTPLMTTNKPIHKDDTPAFVCFIAGMAAVLMGYSVYSHLKTLHDYNTLPKKSLKKTGTKLEDCKGT